MENENEIENPQGKLTPYTGDIKGEIELPKINVSPYIGKKVKIVSAEPVNNQFGGVSVQVLTEVVDTITTGKNPIQLRGSKLLSLQKDVDGNVGWGAETKTGQFLKKYKVKKYKDLIGKEVVLITTVKKGTTTEYLTFN